MPSRLLLLPVTAIVLSGAIRAQNDSLSVPHITVNGTARKEVVPDLLYWSLAVKTTHLDLTKVADLHAKKVGALLDLLKANRIPDKDVQTAQMQFSENRVYRHNEHVKEGYIAETHIGFKLSDIGKYKALWLAIAGLSEVSVTGVSLDHSKRIELNKETRKLALQMAREKAAAMAAELGCRVGEPLAIEEDLSVSEGWRPPNMMFNNTVVQQAGFAPGEGSREDLLAPGSIPITIRVRITFRLLNNAN